MSHDGRRIFSGSQDGTLRLWSFEERGPHSILPNQKRFFNKVAISADGRRALSRSTDGTVKVWDLERSIEIRTLQSESTDVSGLAILNDNTRGGTSPAAGRLRAYAPPTAAL